MPDDPNWLKDARIVLRLRPLKELCHNRARKPNERHTSAVIIPFGRSNHRFALGRSNNIVGHTGDYRSFATAARARPITRVLAASIDSP